MSDARLQAGDVAYSDGQFSQATRCYQAVLTMARCHSTLYRFNGVAEYAVVRLIRNVVHRGGGLSLLMGCRLGADSFAGDTPDYPRAIAAMRAKKFGDAFRLFASSYSEETRTPVSMPSSDPATPDETGYVYAGLAAAGRGAYGRAFSDFYRASKIADRQNSLMFFTAEVDLATGEYAAAVHQLTLATDPEHAYPSGPAMPTICFVAAYQLQGMLETSPSP